MEFIKYPSLVRLGNTEVEGILEGQCHVFPKIDGTNASVWHDGTEIQAGSRNRHLSLEADNAGFLAHVRDNEALNHFFYKHPTLRLYGEWLVPHALKTYRDEAWRKFYIFDVMDGERFLPYDEYKEILDIHDDLDYLPSFVSVKDPREERLYNYLEANNFLIKDGEGIGEGIVIKNYDFVNKYGRVTWAKLVSSEFNETKFKTYGPSEVNETSYVEEKIAREFTTTALVEKTVAKILNDKDDGWSAKDIPRLLNTVFYDIVNEDMWDIIKKYKQPTIDFRRLMRYVIAEIKVKKPEYF